MKRICSLLAATLFFGACNHQNAPAAQDSVQTSSATPDLTRLYTGDFGGSPIYINFNYAKGKRVAGYNSHKGLRRNVSGEISQEGDGWLVVLQEPGDHLFDGVFTIHFNKDLTEGKGNWKPLQAGSTGEKNFTLVRSNTSDGEGFFADEHGDIYFQADGGCVLQYYPKTGDSTWATQMEIVRGTYTSPDDSTIQVSWQPHEQFGKRSSVFRKKYEGEADGRYLAEVSGEGFNFTMMP